MFVACSTQCFARHPLERALRIINELEFSKVDIAIHEQGPHLRPSEVQHDLALALQRIRIGPSLSPAAFDVEIEAPTTREYACHLRAVCKLARQAAVAVLTIPAASNRSSFDTEILRLRDLVHLVETEGLTLTVATRVGTLTGRTPRVLKLTGDPAYERAARYGLTGLALDEFQRSGSANVQWLKAMRDLVLAGADRYICPSASLAERK